MKQTLPQYIDPAFIAPLAQHGLDDFDALWARDIEWFEPPNQRRGGWSGVGRLELNTSSAQPLILFVKKQENHGRRSWRHPFSGEPTFRREFLRLQTLAAAGVLAPRVVVYSESSASGQQRAILVTENLTNFCDVERLLPAWAQWPHAEKLLTLRRVAEQVRHFHDLGLVHRALYPKHLFLHGRGAQAKLAFIDLEKARHQCGLTSRMLFDLSALQRHTPMLSRAHRLLFFKHYLGVKQLSRFDRWCLMRIIRRSQR